MLIATTLAITLIIVGVLSFPYEIYGVIPLPSGKQITLVIDVGRAEIIFEKQYPTYITTDWFGANPNIFVPLPDWWSSYWWHFKYRRYGVGGSITVSLVPMILGLFIWPSIATLRRCFVKRPEGLCPACNYDLRGSVGSETCPECGEGVVGAEKVSSQGR